MSKTKDLKHKRLGVNSGEKPSEKQRLHFYDLSTGRRLTHSPSKAKD